MLIYLQQYISEVFAAFAIIIAAAANWRSVRTEKEVKLAQKYTRRMDMLVEIERKNSAVGKLALITAQKILLLQQCQNLISSPSEEIERLRANLNILEGFRESEDKHRHIAEAAADGNNVELHLQALTDIQRLRVRMEADVDKETRVYNELLEKARN